MHSTTRLATVPRMIQAVGIPLQTGAQIPTQRVIIFPNIMFLVFQRKRIWKAGAPGARYGDFKVGQGSSPILADVVTIGCSSGRLEHYDIM